MSVWNRRTLVAIVTLPFFHTHHLRDTNQSENNLQIFMIYWRHGFILFQRRNFGPLNTYYAKKKIILARVLANPLFLEYFINDKYTRIHNILQRSRTYYLLIFRLVYISFVWTSWRFWWLTIRFETNIYLMQDGLLVHSPCKRDNHLPWPVRRPIWTVWIFAAVVIWKQIFIGRQ